MKKIVLLIIGLVFMACCYAQQGSTYAIIVGISQYESSSIPTLNFAHKDAIAFAQYLRTKAGGNVPEQNMRVLIAEQATTAAVYDAMNWVLKTAKQNDLVYFYFAGHGDMENTTIYKLGFLLTYNTPANNYINNSIRMEDVNNFANTLSTNTKAKVIMITDACHSGKLAGNDFRGNLLVGNQLRTATANEIRITSCAPDELSNENEAWGGGRGVFSYYLINGLIGYADVFKDGFVRLNEVKTFMDSAMQNDPILISNDKVQRPVIPVNSNTKEFVVSVVDSAQMKQQATTAEIMPAPVMLNMEEQSFEGILNDVFQFLDKEDVSKFDSLSKMLTLPVAQYPSFFLKMYQQYIYMQMEDGSTKRLLSQTSKTAFLLQQLQNNNEYINEFNKKLIFLFHTQTQKVINDYLEGSEAELERRRYYNAGTKGYDAYPIMLQLAMNLLDKDHFLYRALQVNRYYFAAVALLLKIPITQNQTPLINEAFQLLNKALQLEQEAAYIYNALGVIYSYKTDFKKAEINYKKASEIAPGWALPYSNLMSVYLQLKKQDKAAEMFEKAKALQPTLQNIYVNDGLLQEQKKNYLLAEEQQQKSILLNSRHFLPFDRLGNVYLTTTQYEKADWYFNEADIRKKGYFLGKFSRMAVLPSFPGFVQDKIPCIVDTNQIKENDVLGYFTWGALYAAGKDTVNALRKWKKTIDLDPRNPLAFHYYGLLCYEQKNFKEAALYFNYAAIYWMDTAAIRNYADSLKAFTTPEISECVVRNFRLFAYEKVEDHYFLAFIYEKWNHFAEAEQQYRRLIRLQPGYIGAYMKLWQLLEKIGRYKDAEEVIKLFAVYDKALSANELAGFYERVTQKFPDDLNWHLAAGFFYHQFTKGGLVQYETDRKRIFPDSKFPEYVKKEVEHGKANRPPEILPARIGTIYFVADIDMPYTKGIEHLLIADSLLSNNDDLSAEINDKLGDLYKGQGLPTYAAAAYQKSVDLQPQNSSVRMKLIETYDATYQYTSALMNLDTLLSRNEINFYNILLLAKYNMHQGNFVKAETLLNDAQAIHPYTMPQVLELFGRLYTLSNKPKQAINYYEKYLTKIPDDANVIYSVSRLYAQQNNTSKAWQWLRKAFDAGFNYNWVLTNDPFMNKLRNTSKWKQLLSTVKFKTYPPPKNVYERAEKGN